MQHPTAISNDVHLVPEGPGEAVVVVVVGEAVVVVVVGEAVVVVVVGEAVVVVVVGAGVAPTQFPLQLITPSP
jgi:hypothetical protein